MRTVIVIILNVDLLIHHLPVLIKLYVQIMWLKEIIILRKQLIVELLRIILILFAVINQEISIVAITLVNKY